MDLEKDLVDFLKRLLILDPSKRLKTTEMLHHTWLSDQDLSINEGCNSIQVSEDDNLSQSSGKISESDSDETIQMRSKRNRFRNSFSSRARKHFAGSSRKGINTVVLTNTNEIEIRLPPVEPETPSFKEAKRTMMEGKKIANTAKYKLR